MADFYTEMAAVAEELIEENGRDVILVKQAATAGDPAKPWRVTSTPATTTVTGKAVFVAPGDLGIAVNTVDDTKRTEQVALFAANNDGGEELETFDLVRDGAEDWRILRAELLKPGGTRLMYMFEVRR